ncbi:MAG: kinase, partial [bacterium]
MVISKTPHRISFFGGGTDYPSFYLENEGKVLGTAIDKYCYITCRRLPPFFEHKYRVIYSKTELVKGLDEIQHPSVRETLKYLEIKDGLAIHCDVDIPALSGMGSSSSFTVGLLKTLYALNGKVISKEELYKEAIYIEQELIKENVGSQDQVWAACGGLNTIEFLQNGEIIVNPIIMKESHL